MTRGKWKQWKKKHFSQLFHSLIHVTNYTLTQPTLLAVQLLSMCKAELLKNSGKDVKGCSTLAFIPVLISSLNLHHSVCLRVATCACLCATPKTLQRRLSTARLVAHLLKANNNNDVIFNSQQKGL